MINLFVKFEKSADLSEAKSVPIAKLPNIGNKKPFIWYNSV